MSALQADLFAETLAPEGFLYRSELIAPAEAHALADRLAGFDFQPHDFHGHPAKRRVISFGIIYDMAGADLRQGQPIPDFLGPVRARAAAFAGLDEAALAQVLINEYRPGAGIGWHRDRPHFGEVVGVSLGAPALLRFRRRRGEGWERASVRVESGSAYLLRGPARTQWQHSVPELEALRYSITFRTLRDSPRSGR
jgi:alkylated DNA repair dioxygenase AlkB